MTSQKSPLPYEPCACYKGTPCEEHCSCHSVVQLERMVVVNKELAHERDTLRDALQEIANTSCADTWPPAYAARTLSRLGMLDV